jgi:hypothetical protein
MKGEVFLAFLMSKFLVHFTEGMLGVGVGYSWGIRMYRVCIGYVSGMYREYIERNGMRVGSSTI